MEKHSSSEIPQSGSIQNVKSLSEQPEKNSDNKQSFKEKMTENRDAIKKKINGWDNTIFIKWALLVIAVCMVLNTILLFLLVGKTYDVQVKNTVDSYVTNTVDSYVQGGSVEVSGDVNVSGSVDCDNLNEVTLWNGISRHQQLFHIFIKMD